MKEASVADADVAEVDVAEADVRTATLPWRVLSLAELGLGTAVIIAATATVPSVVRTASLWLAAVAFGCYAGFHLLAGGDASCGCLADGERVRRAAGMRNLALSGVLVAAASFEPGVAALGEKVLIVAMALGVSALIVSAAAGPHDVHPVPVRSVGR